MNTRAQNSPLTSKLVKLGLVLGLAFSLSAQAAPETYAVSFNSTIGDKGVGSFVWDDATLAMTDFNWTFSSGSGSFKDSALAKTIYSPGSARSVGALLFNLLTNPVAYWTSTNGLLSASAGYFSENFFGSSGVLTGAYPPDMLGIGYKKGEAMATFEMLDLSPTRTVLSAGTISASPVPEPGSVAMLISGMAILAAIRRRTPTNSAISHT